MSESQSDGVVAAMNKEWFWQGLEQLRDVWGMDKDDLRTFMSDSVDAAMSERVGCATPRTHRFEAQLPVRRRACTR